MTRVARALAVVAVVTGLTAGWTEAQTLDGYGSVMFDVLPDVERPSGERRAVAEWRTRLFVEGQAPAGTRLRLTAAGFVEGLVARRDANGLTRAALARPLELHAEWRWDHADVRVGLTRVAWGRLDEFLPTDVVNPQDLTRFFLEGRAESRLPVGMVRARLLPSDRFGLEAIYVPFFRRGRFDQLDEASAPFNLAAGIPRVANTPPTAWSSAQGGLRASVTTGRVDWSISGYRGFETLPIYEPGIRGVQERFPRFTMLGADVETVRGPWGIRGELAAFVDRTLALPRAPFSIAGRTFEAGVGVDRRAGGSRLSGTLLVTARQGPAGVPLDGADALVVASIDRAFARETRRLRTFAAYNPGDRSAFARVIASFSLSDRLALETSVGLFAGSAVDVLSRFASRDFFYARMKVFL